MYDAINKGVNISTGDYIMVLNSDDWYFPKTIEYLVSLASNHDKRTIVSGLASEFSEKGRKFLRNIPLRSWNYSANLRMPLRHELMLVPSFIYAELDGYDSSYKLAGDLDICSRIKLDESINILQTETYLMGFRAGGMGYKLSKTLKTERMKHYKKIFGKLPDAFLEALSYEAPTDQIYDSLHEINFDSITNARNLILACRDYLGGRGFYQVDGNLPKWRILSNWAQKF